MECQFRDKSNFSIIQFFLRHLKENSVSIHVKDIGLQHNSIMEYEEKAQHLLKKYKERFKGLI